MNNGNMPAMPIIEVDGEGNPVAANLGLTKREHFAAMAMQGSLSGDRDDLLTIEDIAIQSRQMADALLRELEANDG